MIVTGTKCINVKFAEILGISLMLPSAIFITIAYTASYFIDNDDSNARRTIIETFAVVYLIVANFLTTDYLPHLATR